MIELCIPSSVDRTVAPEGKHVISLFTQYTPYMLQGKPWTKQDRDDYANKSIFYELTDFTIRYTVVVDINFKSFTIFVIKL